MRTIGEYDEQYVRRQRPARLWLKILAGVAFVVVTVTVLGFVLGWFRAGTQVISPANVKAQWQFAYDYEASLGSAARNWCTAKKAEDVASRAGNIDAANQRGSQRIAVEQNYARIKAAYDGRLADAFRAKLVKPSDVPDRAPELTDKLAEVGCAVKPD